MAVRDQLGQDAERIVDVGSEIVFSGRVSYHPVFGISLVLEEIDLHAILGEAEKRKQETIAFLKKQGAFEWNRSLNLPRITQNIAIVGSPGTSGFRDFGMHLMRNDWGVGFDVEVFPTSVQGADAPAAIQLALDRAIAWRPDAIVMVRGGGSALDLDAFNSKDLCLSIAQSPIPVLTGVGHETDLSVADLVAHQHFKTPTAVADFLVDRLLQERSFLADRSITLGNVVRHRLHLEKERIARDLQTICLQPKQQFISETRLLTNIREQLSNWTVQAIQRQRQSINHLLQTVDALQPTKTMARGFSVTRKAGKVILKGSDLEVGDQLNIQFHQGQADVIVHHIYPSPNE